MSPRMRRHGRLWASIFAMLVSALWSAPIVQAAACGDIVVEVPEQYDDGNLVNGDGCSATCEHRVSQP